MKKSIAPPVITDEQARANKLKAMSDARKSKWPNTLEATRKKKLQFLEDKAAKEEAERKVIDAEEAAIRSKARRECIERANEILYEQTDKMKML